jgi:hypothetical protein
MFVTQFRRKRAFAHPGGISLNYSNYPADMGGAYSCSYTGSASGRMGRSYIRISSVVNIQKSSLGSFK